MPMYYDLQGSFTTSGTGSTMSCCHAKLLALGVSGAYTTASVRGVYAASRFGTACGNWDNRDERAFGADWRGPQRKT